LSDILKRSIEVSTYYVEIKQKSFTELCKEIDVNVTSLDAWVKQAQGVPSSLSCLFFRLTEINLFEH